MSKPAERRDYVSNYILERLQEIYEDLQNNRITKKEYKKYPNVTTLINMVFENERFIDTASPNFEFRQPTQIAISKNTIRKAVNKLIADNKIKMGNGTFEYVPHLEKALEQHPILSVAQQVQITIGVPENILVLTVSNNLANSVAAYLSSQFYKGDIIFIPIGNHIICISVYPESALRKSANNPNVENSSTNPPIKSRIERVLHNFSLQYPNFEDGLLYEFGYLMSHNPQIIAATKNLIHDEIRHKCVNTEAEIFQRMQETALLSPSEAIEYGESLVSPQTSTN